MITGSVSRRRAYVPLTVRGTGADGEVEFVLDTGFTGVTTLPPAACTALALPFLRRQPSFAANRQRVVLDVYEMTLIWDGAERQVEVLAMEGPPLIGMTLLDGYNLRVQAVDGGLVTIERI
jgi:clan AA aspartic protease